MDYSRKEDEFTVQGGDTPVPVRDMSGRAGSPGPSANDCSALPVGNQAGSGYKATRNREGGKSLNPIILGLGRLQRSNSLPKRWKPLSEGVAGNGGKGGTETEQGSSMPDPGRKRKDMDSPAEGGGRPSLNLSYQSLIWDDSEKRSVKKSREDIKRDEFESKYLESNVDMNSKVVGIIRKLDKNVRALRKIAKGNKNTRVDIKDLVDTICSEMSQLCTSEILGIIDERERSTEILIIKETEDKETQTPREAWKLRNDNSAVGIKRSMAESRDFENFRKIERIAWPPEVYTRTSVVEGNPVWETTEMDLALCLSPGDRLDRGMARQFARKFPEVMELATDKNSEAFHMVSYEAKVNTGNDSSRISKKTASVIFVDENMEKTFDNCVKWRNGLRDSGIKRVAVVKTEAAIPAIRRLLEFVFWEEDIKVMLYEPGDGRKEAMPNKGTRPLPPRNTKATAKKAGAVVVSAEGKSYADLLRAVKGKVDATSVGVNIKTVRKTRNGGLLLTVDGGEEEAKALEREILGKCAGDGFRARGTGGEDVLLHIKGIDPSMEEEGVRQAIRSTTGSPDDKVAVKSMRPAYGGNLNATVIVGKETAEKLLNQGTLKIGWTTCKVIERVELRRCHRCWEAGHSAERCDGVDRRNLCLRCGNDSHKAKDCREDLFCPLCVVGAHRADSMGCPKFREHVKRTRDRRNQNRQQLARPSQERESADEAEPVNSKTQTADKEEDDASYENLPVIINDSSQQPSRSSL